MYTAKRSRLLLSNSRPRRGRYNAFSNRSIGMKSSYEIDASRSWPRTMRTPKLSVGWTSRERLRVATRRWVPVVSGMVTVGKWTTVWWAFISATVRPVFKCCWIARCTFRKIGPTTLRAENNVRSGRDRVPDKTADRVGPDRSRAVQRRERISLDVR